MAKEKEIVPVEYNLRRREDRERFRAEFVPKAPVLGPLFDLVDELLPASPLTDRIEQLEKRIDEDFAELQIYRKNSNLKEAIREFLENLDAAVEVRESRSEEFTRQHMRDVDGWSQIVKICRFDDELADDFESED